MKPIVPVEPPAPATYERVLRRYDRSADLQIRYSAYDVNLMAKPIECNGIVATTLFFPPGRGASAERARALGWVDETEAYRRHLSGEVSVQVKPVPAPRSEPIETLSKPQAGSQVRSSPSGVEPLPGVAPVRRKAKSKE